MLRTSEGRGGRGRLARRVALAAAGLAVAFAAIALVLAGTASRNGHEICEGIAPSNLTSSDEVVQNKHQVSLFPLVITCSYTTQQQPIDSDYEAVTADLGTGWWVAALAMLLATVIAWVVGSSRATHAMTLGPKSRE